ncbi:hypothetical protein NMY22_g14129 [Coprinellus aureogranulatus]|nr:hypothetical protein NMY22_g14129 [Coprinellus aureogranulatus]
MIIDHDENTATQGRSRGQQILLTTPQSGAWESVGLSLCFGREGEYGVTSRVCAGFKSSLLCDDVGSSTPLSTKDEGWESHRRKAQNPPACLRNCTASLDFKLQNLRLATHLLRHHLLLPSSRLSRHPLLYGSVQHLSSWAATTPSHTWRTSSVPYASILSTPLSWSRETCVGADHWGLKRFSMSRSLGIGWGCFSGWLYSRLYAEDGLAGRCPAIYPDVKAGILLHCHLSPAPTY